MRIDCILFEGSAKRSKYSNLEADEYVQIINQGDASQELEGWVLKDRDDRGQEFAFPSHPLRPRDVVRVYTNQVHAEWGGFTFGRGSPVWNNSDADTVVLLDGVGVVVSQKTYDTDSPPGCSQ